MKFTVTIARQLGSGGSEVGQRVAEALGVRCIDREIVSRTARQCALSEEEIAAREEKVSSFWNRMLSGFVVAVPETIYQAPPFQTHSDRQIFEEETEVMKSIVQQEDCVIVGRGAAHILPRHARTVNILLYAPLSFRIPRVMEVYGAASKAEARTRIEQSDTMRGKSIAQMTGHDWMEACNYHLCLDSSSLPLPDLSSFIVEYLRRKLSL